MLLSKSRAIFSLSLLTLALMVTPAYSTTITTYSSLATWQAAASGTQLIDFETLGTVGNSKIYSSGISQSGVQFIGLGGSTIGVMDTSAFSWANFNSGYAGFSYLGNQSLRIIMPAAVTAFSIELFSLPPAVSYTATVLGTPFAVPTAPQPIRTFWGVTSDTTIPSVDLALQSGGTYAFFDNFRWGTAEATTQAPEAGTFLLIGSGLIGLAVFRRRRQLR